MLPPRGQCAWACGSNCPLNVEHVIAHQVATALKLDYPVPVSWGYMHNATLTRRQDGEQDQEPLQIALPERVCVRCNAGWMQKLDKRMLAFMEPTLDHHATVQLNGGRQLILARWILKVGLLLGLWLHDQPLLPADAERRSNVYVPADNFPRLHKDIHLPPRTRIWIGALADIPFSDFFITAQPIQSESGAVGYWLLVKLKRLVFYVTGLAVSYDGPVIEDWPNPQACVPKRGAMPRLWPLSQSVIEWPPPTPLHPEDLGRVVQAKPYIR